MRQYLFDLEWHWRRISCLLCKPNVQIPRKNLITSDRGTSCSDTVHCCAIGCTSLHCWQRRSKGRHIALISSEATKETHSQSLYTRPALFGSWDNWTMWPLQFQISKSQPNSTRLLWARKWALFRYLALASIYHLSAESIWRRYLYYLRFA